MATFFETALDQLLGMKPKDYKPKPKEESKKERHWEESKYKADRARRQALLDEEILRYKLKSKGIL